MSGDNSEKKYEPFRIPARAGERPNAGGAPRRDGGSDASFSDGMFYEIDYSASPIEGVGKFVARAQRIVPPERDAKRERFMEMRGIARRYETGAYGGERFPSRGARREFAVIFTEQARFMADFEDDYEGDAPFSAYYPDYRMLSYEQFRTYFTWRTRVRAGDVRATSLSYAFIYIYELINNIGTASPEDGLEKLIDFWRRFREYDLTLDKYVPGWIKDYHIYYDLEGSFRDFAAEHTLSGYYPMLTDPKDGFGLLAELSGYDIRSSAFYAENRELVERCADFTAERLREKCSEAGLAFDDLLFSHTKHPLAWTPFRGAVFRDARRQRDRTAVLLPNEVYVSRNSVWTYSTALTSSSGKRLAGFILKRMEAELRRLTKYRHKLTASPAMLDGETRQSLAEAGMPLEETIVRAAAEFYREATKTIVTVSSDALARIRRDALETQEALLVEEDTSGGAAVPTERHGGSSAPADILPVSGAECISDEKPYRDGTERISDEEPCLDSATPASGAKPESVTGEAEDGRAANVAEFAPSGEDTAAGEAPYFGADEPADEWDALGAALAPLELAALRHVLHGGDMESFARENGVMPEVLAEGINEKAADAVGDSVLDDGLMIYEDYAERLREMTEKYAK